VILVQDILEICCGLDVHRDTVVACLLKGNIEGLPSKEIRTFSTLLPGLEELRTWLEEEQCHHVAMESTGVYWQPVNTILEDAFDGNIVIIVTNARHMKNVPGKKTDIKDSEWIATLLRAGLLRGSFIPPQNVRELRDLTRYRKSLIGEISSHKNRVEKYLQSCGFKLSTFLTDIFGVSGRAIINHLAQHGEINADSVQHYVKGRARIKTDDIKIAVNGKMNKHQMDFLKILLKHLNESEERISCIDLKIEDALESFRTQLHQVDGLPGINIVAAAAIIAEIGTDMSNFKTSDHICSWAGLAPGNNESAGKKKVHE
jgi:transposase